MAGCMGPGEMEVTRWLKNQRAGTSRGARKNDVSWERLVAQKKVRRKDQPEYKTPAPGTYVEVSDFGSDQGGASFGGPLCAVDRHETGCLGAKALRSFAPGPGQYSAPSTLSTAKACSFSHRPKHEVMLVDGGKLVLHKPIGGGTDGTKGRAIMKSTPAPGTYTLDTDCGRQLSRPGTAKFGTQTRLKDKSWEVSTTPDPAAYSIRSHAFGRQVNSHNQAGATWKFGTSQRKGARSLGDPDVLRDAGCRQFDDNPAPGAYTPSPGFGGHTQSRAQSAKSCGFGSSSRAAGSQSEKNLHMPDQGTYDVRACSLSKQINSNWKNAPSAMFGASQRSKMQVLCL